MPKTKFQSIIFTVLMVFCMVFCLIFFLITNTSKKSAFRLLLFLRLSYIMESHRIGFFNE